MAAPTAPVVRLSAPGEVIAALPHLCGFVPTESVVVLALHPPRARVGLVVRLDLPPSDSAGPAADLVVGRLRTVRPEQAVIVICTEQADARPHAALVDALRRRCRDAGIGVRDALLVRSDRWWSYSCDDAACCPAEGTPVPRDSASPRLGLLAAEGVLAGRQVLPDRAALVRALAGPVGPAALDAAREHARAGQQWDRLLRQRGPAAATARGLAAWSAALELGGTEDLDRAALVVALGHLPLRDRVLTWALDRSEALLALLLRLAPASPPPYDAAVCTLIAVTAWSRGDGALANVALDRALTSDPDYRLAVLVRLGLEQAVPPAQVRTWLRACTGG